jgi:hypothetical protein
MGGMVLFVNFGWGVGVNTLIAVYLQSPVAEGGYGFNPGQNAECKSLFLFPTTLPHFLASKTNSDSLLIYHDCLL